MHGTRLWARARLISSSSISSGASCRRSTPSPSPSPSSILCPVTHRHYASERTQKPPSASSSSSSASASSLYPEPADDPAFVSSLDAPPVLVRVGGRRSRLGLFVLAMIPVTAFALGTWQVQRLHWKTDLMARLEDRLVREPLPLPPSVDAAVVADFDYRRITATGTFRHDQEMLLGPRLRDGSNGYFVITPLERENGTTVLINRGWIPKEKASQASRREGLPSGEVTVEGLIREPWRRNMFTPDNRPDKGEFYFPDVAQMAALVGAQPVWIEETMTPDLLTAYDRESKGIPIGRAAEVNLRNNHTQYIFTWYSLSAATSVMLWMLLRKAPSQGRIRSSRAW